MNRFWESLPAHLKENPYFHFSEKTNYVPAWDKIRVEHAKPALDYAVEYLRSEVQRIADNPSAPTFRNTVEALEKPFGLIGYLSRVFFCAAPADPEERKQYDAIEKDFFERYHEVFTETFNNGNLFNRFSVLGMAINADAINLNSEKKKLFAMYMGGFRENGIHMRPAKKEQMAALEKQINALSMQVQQNMRRAEEDSFLIVDDPSRLSGLPDFMIDNARRLAEKKGLPGQYMFGITHEVYSTFMRSADDRDLRRQMRKVYSNAGISGPYDNRAAIIKLISLEHRHARLKGHANPAALTLQYNMARDAKTVSRFLLGLRDAARPAALREMDVIRNFARRQGVDMLEAWDIDYYEEKLKKAVLGYDEEELRPYFELENVLQGTFRHFEKLFGLRFIPNETYPKLHPDIRTYDVVRARSGKPMGVIAFDLFARDGKPAGIAWNISAFPQGLFEGKVRRAVDVVVAKFPKGEPGKPNLLTHDDVLTIFHEMGHATHNMLSQCRYASFSGTSVDTDFVEFPSQIQENWAFEPAVLDDFARHHLTGEKISDDIKKKIRESRKFMAGRTVLNRAARGWLDFSWHTRNPANIDGVESFESKVLRKFRLGGSDHPVLSPRFSHIFGGGYDAAFYSYQWAQIMDSAIFAKFSRAGLYDRSLRAKFRHALEQGGRGDEAALFRELNGRAANNKAFLRSRGLLGKAFNYAAAANDNNPPPVPAKGPRFPDKGMG